MRELGPGIFPGRSRNHAGKGFGEVPSQKGMILFVYGALTAVVPLAVGFAAARKICRLNILESHGGDLRRNDEHAGTGHADQLHWNRRRGTLYAATYPAALALIVVLAELIGANL